MTAIERTAYPRIKRNLTAKELVKVYTLTPGERFLAARSTKGSVAEVGFLVLLKTYQRLGRFIPNTGTWSPTRSMRTARAFYSATLIKNGNLLIAGGMAVAALPRRRLNSLCLEQH
jgi:Domain of unknown function (DUF4158)